MESREEEYNPGDCLRAQGKSLEEGGKEKGSRNEEELVPADCTSGKHGTRANAINMVLNTGMGVGSKGR